MNRLIRADSGEYPGDYLAARVTARQGRLLQDWTGIISGPSLSESMLPDRYRALTGEYSQEGVWKRMMAEFKWVYLQMHRGLKKIFEPFFTYHEMKTAIMCLRIAADKKRTQNAADILSFSLLSKEIRIILESEKDPSGIIDTFERAFFSSEPGDGGLKETFEKTGLKGIEESMTGMFFDQFPLSGMHPVVRGFFLFLIDMQNIMTLYKCARWGIRTRPVFIPGGNIAAPDLERVFRSGEMPEIVNLARRISGRKFHIEDPAELERSMLSVLTYRLKTGAREHSVAAVVLYYLWRVRVEARNLSILLYNRTMDRNVLEKELLT